METEILQKGSLGIENPGRRWNMGPKIEQFQYHIKFDLQVTFGGYNDFGGHQNGIKRK